LFCSVLPCFRFFSLLFFSFPLSLSTHNQWIKRQGWCMLNSLGRWT
jgi:hypothetical protein